MQTDSKQYLLGMDTTYWKLIYCTLLIHNLQIPQVSGQNSLKGNAGKVILSNDVNIESQVKGEVLRSVPYSDFNVIPEVDPNGARPQLQTTNTVYSNPHAPLRETLKTVIASRPGILQEPAVTIQQAERCSLNPNYVYSLPNLPCVNVQLSRSYDTNLQVLPPTIQSSVLPCKNYPLSGIGIARPTIINKQKETTNKNYPINSNINQRTSINTVTSKTISSTPENVAFADPIKRTYYQPQVNFVAEQGNTLTTNTLSSTAESVAFNDVPKRTLCQPRLNSVVSRGSLSESTPGICAIHPYPIGPVFIPKTNEITLTYFPRDGASTASELETYVKVQEGIPHTIASSVKSQGQVEVSNTVQATTDIEQTFTGDEIRKDPFNILVNMPPVNVPAPSVTLISASPASTARLPVKAPIVPSFPSYPQIIMESPGSSLRKWLPLLLITLLNDKSEGCCCNSCSCNSCNCNCCGNSCNCNCYCNSCNCKNFP